MPGYEPIEGKLYLVKETHDEAAERPELLHYRLADAPPEQSPDQPIQVRSWYEGVHAMETCSRPAAWTRRSLLS